MNSLMEINFKRERKNEKLKKNRYDTYARKSIEED